MSNHQVLVSTIDSVLPHPNADKLDLAVIKGWQVAVSKGLYKTGDKCVYFPPDSLLKQEVSDKFGVTKYLSSGRVRAQKLRGSNSYGFIVKPELDWEVGTNVADYYQVTKWNPPESIIGDIEKPNQLFHRYTDIENYRNYPSILEGQDVCITEKIHGSNVRIGLCRSENGLELCVGTKNTRQKEFNTKGIRSPYWKAKTEESMMLLNRFADFKDSVILFGELYGPGVQKMTYGLNETYVRFFDMAIDGQYVDSFDKYEFFQRYGLDYSPIIYEGPFSKEVIEDLTQGKSWVAQKETKYDFREGIVITPLQEQTHPEIGRIILKSISVEYLEKV